MPKRKSNEELYVVNCGLAKMLKGGVIMDVSTPEEAIIAEKAGACAVMALDMIPSRIRKAGGVARMSRVEMIKGIQDVVNIPVMAKCRPGHTSEAKILEALDVDYIDESEVLTPADYAAHVPKSDFNVPFVCGARNLGEALRRINEGASMIRTKGEAGTGDISQAVKHYKEIFNKINELKKSKTNKLEKFAKDERVPLELVMKTIELGRLPIVTFAAGGIATPADAALMMSMGVDGVFVGSGIFESSDPATMAESMCLATTNFDNPEILVKAMELSSKPMKGVDAVTADVRYEGR